MLFTDSISSTTIVILASPLAYTDAEISHPLEAGAFHRLDLLDLDRHVHPPSAGIDGIVRRVGLWHGAQVSRQVRGDGQGLGRRTPGPATALVGAGFRPRATSRMVKPP
ncbi:hypothetical protein ITP53_46775 [Nonomuraea sp. K274]|uniref:Uncharacterized protein n=1 Tax=Nonomuraea cypriaca TaxID=1187855 RepID=A0A931F2K0_9ACTN|nr:hypothetical protein [Nonomuraea cypriaca]MBF8193054.1 hypothetical protein [Nonomuraea cypriaca]